MSEETDQTVYQRLAARFPTEDHKTRKQAGRDLTYLTGEQVISRLNEVLGIGGWNFRVLREGSTEVEAWVLGELTIYSNEDGATYRQQFGNQDLMRGQYPTTDLFKSAATDALKKCATTIGVGLYLYDEDERREVEQEMRAARQAPPPAGKVEAAARITGAPPKPSRHDLEAAYLKGVEYAKSIGIKPEVIATHTLSVDDLTELVAGLREQCQYVLDEQKKAKAKQAETTA